MDNFDSELQNRLSSLEQGLSVRGLSRSRRRRGSLSRLLWAGLGAGLLTGILVAGTVGGAVLEAVRGYPGVFSAGGALACTDIPEMSPPEANRLLAELGYRVTWQIEDRDARSSEMSADPPPTGYIIEGTLKGRDMLVIVETGARAEPVTVGC